MICHYCNQRLGYRFFAGVERVYWVCRVCHEGWTKEKKASEVRELEAMYAAESAEDGGR